MSTTETTHGEIRRPCAKEVSPKVWLVISSYQNDRDVIRILDHVHSLATQVLEHILIVDSHSTGAIPAHLSEHGWQHVTYRSYDHNLGSGGNLCERLRLAAEGGADYAYAINHDGGFDPEVATTLLKAAVQLPDLGAAYPLSFLTSAGSYNVTGTRELPLPSRLVSSPPSDALIDVFWSSSNGALYSMTPVRKGLLPWPVMWMGWEDLEYGWRLSDNGYRQVIVRDAVYRDNYEYQQRWFSRMIDKPAWRTYYSFRNLFLAIRRSRNRPSFYAVAAYRALLECGLILLARDNKTRRLGRLSRGVIDGLTQDIARATEAWGETLQNTGRSLDLQASATEQPQ